MAISNAALFVSNLSDNVKETEFRGIFQKYGRLKSVRLFKDSAGKSLGYATELKKTVASLNFTAHFGREIRIVWRQPNQQIYKNGIGNLIIQNLPKTMTNIELHEIFSRFGTIMSCQIMMNKNNESRGYG
ncbi:hypothetical protein SNEBB_000201 [Seison nebaliae]|nr:hypothetical protein SNEBB_000201 [Seison nebaliae]